MRKKVEGRILKKRLEKTEEKVRSNVDETHIEPIWSDMEGKSDWFKKSDKQSIGENNWTEYGFDLNLSVTLISLFILVLFIGLTLSFPRQAENIFFSIMALISRNVGWFFILAGNIFVVSGVAFAYSKYGSIRIGGKNAKPEFSNFAWYSMLLSAGMGIGLVFWSVAEPISHLNNPSPLFGNIANGSPEAAQAAMATTFFHWGIHPWAIYALVGLALAFFAYNKGLPMTVRSVFYPLIGNKIYGFWGNLIDILAVLATVSGLATSLGLGVSQVNAGLNHLFGIPINTTIQIILIVIITAIATFTVISGLDNGVKMVSELNMKLAGIFLIAVLILGPTVYILSGFTQNVGYYIANFVEMSTWTETFRDTAWQSAWTIFYWSWWISWSPFVGMFIARISKGRTVKEFILGVMIIPSLISFIWMSVFGSASIFQEINGYADIIGSVVIDESLAMFVFLESLPLGQILSVISLILIVIFFITSANSGALVVDSITSGGKLNTPNKQKFIWAALSGVVASALLVGGGLNALQTASVITGLPFAIILILLAIALRQGLKQEYEIEESIKVSLNEVRHQYRIETVIKDVLNEDDDDDEYK